MVARPPIEKWNRAELEDNYHNVLQQMKEYQKQKMEMEKKLTQLNSKFRRAVMDRKSNGLVEKDKFDQLVNENQLLSMKLKSVKHQLLTYTAPTARAQTASAMTGRSTFRPPSTVRRQHPSNFAIDKTGRSESAADTSRPGVVRIVENSLAEKANIIRLNRQVREKNAQVTSLQYDLQSAKSQLEETRMLLDQKSKEADELAKSVNASTSAGSETTMEAEVLRQELAIARQELSVLNSANERLVKQSLSQEAVSLPAVAGDDSSDLRREMVISQERLKSTEKKLRETQRQLSSWKTRANKLKEAAEKGRYMPQPTISQHPPSKQPSEFDDDFEDEEIHYTPKRKERKEKLSKADAVLVRLYEDVSGFLQSHSPHDLGDGIIGDQMSPMQKVAKWQKMYSELYKELEKGRNLLLSQYNINQKQNSEIALLKEECDRLRLEGEMKIKEIRLKVEEKQKKIDILEQQIHSIAYSGQKPVAVLPKVDEPEMSTRLTMKLTGLRFLGKFEANSVFMALEFFDFELQTTPVIKGETQKLDFATFYDIVVSNLLLHYIKSDGITIELYKATSASYELVAAGVVGLSDLIKQTKPSLLSGDLKLRDDTGRTVAVITYELSTTKELAEALQAYQRAEKAQALALAEAVLPDPDWNELAISVQRCTGLDKISSEPLEVCIVYEFLAFSPYVTLNQTGTKSVEINNDKLWPLPSEALQFFGNQEISFYLLDRSAMRQHDGVLAMVSLPLAPLLSNTQIRGSFPMIKADGTEPGVFLDICMKWRYDFKLPKELSKVSGRDEESPSERLMEVPIPLQLSPPPESDKKAIQREPNRRSFSEEEVESIPSSSVSDESVQTIEKVEPRSPVRMPSMEGLEEEERRSSSSGSTSSRDTFTKEMMLEPEIGEDDDRLTPIPPPPLPVITSHLRDLPPIAKPRFSVSRSLSIGQESERTSEEDNGRHLVGFTSPLHRSIPPSETSSISSPKDRPPVSLPKEGGKSVIKVLDRIEDQIQSDGSEQTVTITIHKIVNTNYTPIMEKRFENMKFLVDWKFLDYPEEDCRVSESHSLPAPIVFEFTKEYHLSRRRVALLEQYVETPNHLEFCLVTDCADESEELAVATMEMSRIPPEEPMLIPLLDINAIRWGDLEVSINYSPDIFNQKD